MCALEASTRLRGLRPQSSFFLKKSQIREKHCPTDYKMSHLRASTDDQFWQVHWPTVAVIIIGIYGDGHNVYNASGQNNNFWQGNVTDKYPV